MTMVGGSPSGSAPGRDHLAPANRPASSGGVQHQRIDDLVQLDDLPAAAAAAGDGIDSCRRPSSVCFDTSGVPPFIAVNDDSGWTSQHHGWSAGASAAEPPGFRQQIEGLLAEPWPAIRRLPPGLRSSRRRRAPHEPHGEPVEARRPRRPRASRSASRCPSAAIRWACRRRRRPPSWPGTGPAVAEVRGELQLTGVGRIGADRRHHPPIAGSVDSAARMGASSIDDGLVDQRPKSRSGRSTPVMLLRHDTPTRSSAGSTQ